MRTIIFELERSNDPFDALLKHLWRVRLLDNPATDYMDENYLSFRTCGLAYGALKRMHNLWLRGEGDRFALALHDGEVHAVHEVLSKVTHLSPPALLAIREQCSTPKEDT